MDFVPSSIYDPLNDHEIFQSIIPNFVPSTHLEPEGDQIIPSLEQQNELHNLNLLCQIPNFTQNPPLGTNHILSQQRKRSLASTLLEVDHNQGNGIHVNSDKKKKQKIIHREIERQRRLEMSSLHSSLKSLLPLEYTKGKRSISDHLEEAVKYIQHTQHKIRELNVQRDELWEQESNIKGHDHHDVTVNVFKGCLEVIVSTRCENEGDQGLPLSKVLKCLCQEGLDVVSSISRKVNTKFVHSIHAQVGDEDSFALDAVDLKKKLADIQR